MKKFKVYLQHDMMDCGPTCLRMVSKHYGRNIRIQRLRDLCEINKEGVSLLGISDAAEKIGFRSLGAKLNHKMLQETELPCILHWRQNHFVVLYRVKNGKYHIADPASGLISYTESEFLEHWCAKKDQSLEEGLFGSNSTGVALILTATPKLDAEEDAGETDVTWGYLFQYLVRYKGLIGQLFAGLAIGSMLQLIAPFLTQSIVDIGINTRNLTFLYAILIAQAVLIVSRVSVEFIRSWILLHVSTRVNISVVTDFLIKLMKLPLSFFDSKNTGDVMQRMNDQKRIESFITGNTLPTIFSILNLVVLSGVLLYYDSIIFLVFGASTTLYGIWLSVFLKQRATLDAKRFDIAAKNQSGIVQLIQGMQEIKLNNCEQQKRWDWEHIQAKLFKYSVQTLSLNQYQQGGATFISELSGLLITFLCATAVLNGRFTLGSMMAVQLVMGQLNGTVLQFAGFMQGFQDAKLSLERLNELQQLESEEPDNISLNNTLPDEKTIRLRNVSFKYPGAGNEHVLNTINLIIPKGKVTAIVGMSGSGKTTILKLLLRFYKETEGEILIGDTPLKNISFKSWRNDCGVVMQDGYIFSDTIARNIAVTHDSPDRGRLLHAIKVANIKDLIDTLPMGLNTKIGPDGHGISQGQRQRILIARAVYKNPHYIFFDEATNSLDANNESMIMDNLATFFVGRTVVVVAHRLSTVTHADNIIVMEQGRIVEQGTHHYLSSIKGDYYKLIKNQLQLGN